MDVYELLKEDHRKVARLLKKLETTSSRALKSRTKIFLELKEELEMHAFVEERLFYPRLIDANKTAGITLEGYEEHRIIKALLEEMDDPMLVHDEWIAKLHLIKEKIEHHVKEEEGEMFEKARAVLTDEEAIKIGASIATEKAELKASA